MNTDVKNQLNAETDFVIASVVDAKSYASVEKLIESGFPPEQIQLIIGVEHDVLYPEDEEYLLELGVNITHTLVADNAIAQEILSNEEYKLSMPAYQGDFEELWINADSKDIKILHAPKAILQNLALESLLSKTEGMGNVEIVNIPTEIQQQNIDVPSLKETSLQRKVLDRLKPIADQDVSITANSTSSNWRGEVIDRWKQKYVKGEGIEAKDHSSLQTLSIKDAANYEAAYSNKFKEEVKEALWLSLTGAAKWIKDGNDEKLNELIEKGNPDVLCGLKASEIGLAIDIAFMRDGNIQSVAVYADSFSHDEVKKFNHEVLYPIISNRAYLGGRCQHVLSGGMVPPHSQSRLNANYISIEDLSSVGLGFDEIIYLGNRIPGMDVFDDLKKTASGKPKKGSIEKKTDICLFDDMSSLRTLVTQSKASHFVIVSENVKDFDEETIKSLKTLNGNAELSLDIVTPDELVDPKNQCNKKIQKIKRDNDKKGVDDSTRFLIGNSFSNLEFAKHLQSNHPNLLDALSIRSGNTEMTLSISSQSIDNDLILDPDLASQQSFSLNGAELKLPKLENACLTNGLRIENNQSINDQNTKGMQYENAVNKALTELTASNPGYQILSGQNIFYDHEMGDKNTNEIDFLLFKDGKLMIIECKARSIDDNELAQKLNFLRDKFDFVQDIDVVFMQQGQQNGIGYNLALHGINLVQHNSLNPKEIKASCEELLSKFEANTLLSPPTTGSIQQR